MEGGSGFEVGQVTVKNTEVNNGVEAWRGLNATYDAVLVAVETCQVDLADV